ncbi:hypothetical protein AB0M29_05070 [Streptomyces sp. NPDC051976]|uniref:hypothetical protein n=1 Tax=Streptomyces sp. NPDC051976 TaxID=3154947 RepID=UPI0034158DEB
MNLLHAPQTHVDGDYHLAPPACLTATDARWVDLHAALISAGVPPQPGDRTAVHTLARRLDNATIAAIVTWIDSAAGHTYPHTRSRTLRPDTPAA